MRDGNRKVNPKLCPLKRSLPQLTAPTSEPSALEAYLAKSAIKRSKPDRLRRPEKSEPRRPVLCPDDAKKRRKAVHREFKGTAMIYTVASDGQNDVFAGDFLVDGSKLSVPTDLSAHRSRERRWGRPVPVLSKYSLRDRLLIAIGPELSLTRAVEALRSAIEKIEKEGLAAGVSAGGSVIVGKPTKTI